MGRRALRYFLDAVGLQSIIAIDPERAVRPGGRWRHPQTSQLRRMRLTAESGNHESPTGKRRTRLPRPYPVHTLKEALPIPSAIQSDNAGLPFDRILLAEALGTTKASSGFTMKLNSSAKYGLTLGGYSDELIALTPLGEAVVAPRDGGERLMATVEAALHPELFRKFYELLDGRRLPEESYALNIIQRELGIQRELSAECLKIVTANGLHAGVLREIAGSLHVSINGAYPPGAAPTDLNGGQTEALPASRAEEGYSETAAEAERTERPRLPASVFIGHCGPDEVVRTIAAAFDELGIPYEQVRSNGDDSGPLTAQTAAAMRESASAVLVVNALEQESAGDRSRMALEQMLCQLGAAYILYGERIVIVRERRLDLPAEFSGLRAVEFDPDRLEALALPVLGELQRAGAIQVTASP